MHSHALTVPYSAGLPPSPPTPGPRAEGLHTNAARWSLTCTGKGVLITRGKWCQCAKSPRQIENFKRRLNTALFQTCSNLKKWITLWKAKPLTGIGSSNHGCWRSRPGSRIRLLTMATRPFFATTPLFNPWKEMKCICPLTLQDFIGRRCIRGQNNQGSLYLCKLSQIPSASALTWNNLNKYHIYDYNFIYNYNYISLYKYIYV